MRVVLSGVGILILFAWLAAGASAMAQTKGGMLHIYQHDSPASMSIHEEALNSAQNPMMAVFNNLVIFGVFMGWVAHPLLDGWSATHITRKRTVRHDTPKNRGA